MDFWIRVSENRYWSGCLDPTAKRKQKLVICILRQKCLLLQWPWRTEWAQYYVHVGDEKRIKFSSRTLRLRVVDMDGKIPLKRIIQKQVVKWTHLAQDMDTVAGPCEHGSEHLGSIKGRGIPWLADSFSKTMLPGVNVNIFVLPFAWMYRFRMKKVCSISHQYSYTHDNPLSSTLLSMPAGAENVLKCNEFEGGRQ